MDLETGATEIEKSLKERASRNPWKDSEKKASYCTEIGPEINAMKEPRSILFNLMTFLS